MRVGFNPHKDVAHKPSPYLHQVIIPVYIPDSDGYFTDSFSILKLCIKSILKTCHDKTFITVANNGSSTEIVNYLNGLLESRQINEIIHSENIGKLNAVLKGLSGNDIELVTICDADTLFLSGWQQETQKIFSRLPKAGVVGLVPQIRTFSYFCGNVIFDNFFSSRMVFLPVKNPDGMIRFYESIGWKRDYNQNFLKYALGLDIADDLKVILGTGHFAATYKKDIFSEVTTYLGYKLGGNSETYLDELPLKKDYWRLTTYDNYAYHMGNTFEPWMEQEIDAMTSSNVNSISGFPKQKCISGLSYTLKNKLFIRFLKVKWLYEWFLKSRKLPKDLAENFHELSK